MDPGPAFAWNRSNFPNAVKHSQFPPPPFSDRGIFTGM